MDRKRRGFELVEVLIILLIIGILIAIALPNFIRERETGRAHDCISNLRLIEAAKETWCLQVSCKDGATPPPLEELFKGKEVPVCRSEGKYQIGVIGKKATCTVGENTVIPHHLQ